MRLRLSIIALLLLTGTASAWKPRRLESPEIAMQRLPKKLRDLVERYKHNPFGTPKLRRMPRVRKLR